uniref:Uncharacterized protein n=1 Tax=uncultured marine thaumarchaeote KM3_47_F06 TaxID=1456168 RepID=A0A075H7B7_9ARCH|nr:hypothetical protein [uncultured marine thaumarchaeote KM3_47_F06]
MTLNDKEIKKFASLFAKIKQDNIDCKEINNLKGQPEFSDCTNLLVEKFGSQIKNKDGKEKTRTAEIHLHEIIIEYKKEKPLGFSELKFSNLIARYNEYLQEGQNIHYFMCPIYNFESRIYEMQIDESIKIRKIAGWEKDALYRYYDNYTPIKVQIPKIEYVMIISVGGKESERTAIAIEKRESMLNKFRICSRGDIKFGGFYGYSRSENWNPTGKFDRIEYERPGMHSSNKYKLDKRKKEQFLNLMKKISNRYPNNERYIDYFDKVIRRFASAMEKVNPNDKITDLVICIETLLVPGSGESSLRFQLHSALFLGNDNNSRRELMDIIEPFYNFRSGQVHSLEERHIQEKGKPEMEKEKAAIEIEDLTRKAILKMIFFSQENGYEDLEPKDLVKKIGEAVFDDSLKEKFVQIGKEISFN